MGRNKHNPTGRPAPVWIHSKLTANTLLSGISQMVSNSRPSRAYFKNSTQPRPSGATDDIAKRMPESMLHAFPFGNYCLVSNYGQTFHWADHADTSVMESQWRKRKAVSDYADRYRVPDQGLGFRFQVPSRQPHSSGRRIARRTVNRVFLGISKHESNICFRRKITGECR